jgi:hypothetical protein
VRLNRADRSRELIRLQPRSEHVAVTGDVMMNLPALVTYILTNAAAGAAAGLIMAAALVATDVAGLGTLIFESSDPIPPVALLALGFATMMGSLAAGAAIMRLPEQE